MTASRALDHAHACLITACALRISKRSLRGTAPTVPKLELHMQAFYAVQINFRLEGELHAKNYFQLRLCNDFHTGDMCQVKVY